MATASLRLEPSREALSQTIVDCLKSWPEMQRRVFVEIHYSGRSIEEAARILGLPQHELRQILQNCERRLYRALRGLRDGECHDAHEDSLHSMAYIAAGCIR